MSVVVLFHVHTRDGVDEAAYEADFVRMLGLAGDVPGFLGFDAFAGEDGSELALVRFEDEAAVSRWREHPEHVLTRERGRVEFFDRYDITVAEVTRQYDWRRSDGAAPPPDDDLPLSG